MKSTRIAAFLEGEGIANNQALSSTNAGGVPSDRGRPCARGATAVEPR